MTFWKPSRKVKNNFIKVARYPKRSAKELKLIDKKPLADTDKDRLMNWFDCRPLNRKKQDFYRNYKSRVANAFVSEQQIPDTTKARLAKELKKTIRRSPSLQEAKMITMYHGTTNERAAKIDKEGLKEGRGIVPHIYVTPSKEIARGYSLSRGIGKKGTIYKVNIPVKSVANSKDKVVDKIRQDNLRRAITQEWPEYVLYKDVPSKHLRRLSEKETNKIRIGEYNDMAHGPERPDVIQKILKQEMSEKEEARKDFAKKEKSNNSERKNEEKLESQQVKQTEKEESKLKREITVLSKREEKERKMYDEKVSGDAWVELDEEEKLSVAKRMAVDPSLHEYQQDRIARELVSSFNKQTKR